MATLNAADRRQMPRKDFGQPEKRGFPMNDKTHDRLAISGATRSEHAGNISSSEADRIKAEARAKLHGGDGGHTDPKAALARMHPEHLHKLVQDAHAGKFGPEAQRAAQAAQGGTVEQQGAANDDAGDGQKPAMSARNIFGRGQQASTGLESPDEDPEEGTQGAGQPMNARGIFGGR